MALKVGDLFALLGLDTSPYDKKLREAQRRGERFTDPEIEIQVDTSQVVGAQDNIHRLGEDVLVDVDVDGVTQAKAEIASIPNRVSVDVDTGGGMDKLADRITRAGKAFIGFEVITSLVKWPAMIGGANLAAGAVTALGAATGATVAALGPLVGIGPAIGAGYAAAAQGLGVFKLAFSDFKDAIKNPEEARGSMRRLVDTINGTVKPTFESLRRSTQDAMFPGLIESMGILTPIARQFRPELIATGDAMGDLAVRGSQLVASPAFSGRLHDMAAANVSIIRSFGGAAINAAPGLLILLRAAQPLVQTFADWSATWAKNISGMLAAGEASGKLGAFFERTGDLAAQLGSIVGNLATGIFNVFSGGAKMGEGVIDSLDKTMGKFAEWSRSVEGNRAIEDFWTRVQPTVDALGRLFSDTFDMIGRLFLDNSESAAPFIDSIRTKLLPAIEGIATSVSGEFMDSLISLAATMGELAPLVLGSTGALTTFLDILNLLLTPIVWIMDNVPGASTIVAEFITVFGTIKALSWIHGFFMSVAGAMGITTGATGTLTVALFGMQVPILPLIAVIGLLVGAGYLLVRNWDTVEATALRMAANVVGGLRMLLSAGLSIFESLLGAAARAAEALGMDSVAGRLRNAEAAVRGFRDTANRELGAIQTSLRFTADTSQAQAAINALSASARAMGQQLNYAGRAGMSGPRVAARAGGGTVQANETTLVGEYGPELVRLPTGSQVFTAKETAAMLADVPVTGGTSRTTRAGGSGGPAMVWTGNVVVHGSVITERDLVETVHRGIDTRRSRGW